MKNAPVVLGGLFILVAIVIFYGISFAVPDQTSIFGFNVIDSGDHARQVKEAFKAGLAMGLALCGVLVMVFLWDSQKGKAS